MERTEAESLMFNKVPVQVLTVLRRNRGRLNKRELSDKIGTDHTHVIKMVGRLEDFGLVVSERDGRGTPVKLTELGSDVAENLVEAENCLRGVEIL